MATALLRGLGLVSVVQMHIKIIERMELHEMHPFFMYIFRVYDYPGVVE